MATDGPKIIDGDLAHDTYSTIMDLYDTNADVNTIKEEVPFIKRQYGVDDDFHHEVFVTSYALAFWEIGAMNDEILDEVKTVIEKGACVKSWNEYDPKAAKLRMQELIRLLKKISVPNLKIRNRKKYRRVTNLYFQSDDLLTFKLNNNVYCAAVCTGVFQYRGRCEYVFVPTTYKSLSKPSISDLFDYDVLGTRIGSGYNKQTTLAMQPGVDIFWKLFPEKIEFTPDPPHFFIGLVQYLIPHKNLTQFKNRFEKIGNLKINESFKKEGSSGWATDFERIEERFRNPDDDIKIFQQLKFPIRLLTEI